MSGSSCRPSTTEQLETTHQKGVPKFRTNSLHVYVYDKTAEEVYRSNICRPRKLRYGRAQKSLRMHNEAHGVRN
jgi:hypothetical protein